MLENTPLNFYSPEVNLENANQHINTPGKTYRFSTQTLEMSSHIEIMPFYMIGATLPSHMDMTGNQR